MSLNGLDHASIKEAHDAAAAELGGWFLLNYTSRDEVALLSRGTGGIVEIRNAIAQYEEPSPLFGFLRYRRRNVLIKYVPEDCSRLIQARSSVHFNAVTERFSPHDTVFPITSSKELRDLELSAACSLHTASGSTSSSTSSLRRRRLGEIAEDEEDENKAKRQSTVLEELASNMAPSVTDGDGPPPSSPPPPSAPDDTGDLPAPEPQPRSPTKADEPRKSSQSSRPDLYSSASYPSPGKPKVKLGPRPSLDIAGRPKTSSAVQYRPISTLPAGLKLSSRSSKPKERPKSQYNVEATSMLISPPPIPDTPGNTTPARPHTSGGRPSTSSGASMRSTATLSMNTPKSPTITPEKARLMKALQLRKKNMKVSANGEVISPTTSEEPQSAVSQTASPQSLSPLSGAPLDALPLTAAAAMPVSEGAPKDVHDTLAMLNDMAKEDDSPDISSAVKTEGSDATRSDSYPVSPVGPSDKGESTRASAESTRASSLSESTDETVQGTDNATELVKGEDAGKPTGEPASVALREEVTEQVPGVEASSTDDKVHEELPTQEPQDVPSEIVASGETSTDDTTHDALPTQESKVPQESQESQDGPLAETPTNDSTGEALATQESQDVDEPVQSNETILAEEETTDEAPANQESKDAQDLPSEPAPIVEAPVEDDLPRLLPVTYQPPTSPIKPQQYREESRQTRELPKTEIAPTPETAPNAAREAVAPLNRSISHAEDTPADVTDKSASVEEPAADVPSESTTGHPSWAPNTIDEQISPPKQPLVVATPTAQALLPAQTSPSPKSPVDVEIREWKVPRSKFSIQDLKAAAESPASPEEPLPVTVNKDSLSPNIHSPVGSTFSADAKSATSDEPKSNQGGKRLKRAALVEPIRTDFDMTDLSHAGSEANFSSDDELLDELQSAVVQEAKPISVSKSPMSPHFPSPERHEPGRFSRASSNPLNSDGRFSQLLSPNVVMPESARSVSAGSPFGNASQQYSKPVVKKVNLGSGISQRIKALEQLSKLAPGAATPPPATQGASATFFAVRKGSVRSSKAPSILDRTNSLTRNNTPSPPASQHSSPEALKLHSRTESVQSRVDAFAAGSTPTQQSMKQRPESVSVTARIIRDPNQPFPKSETGKYSEYAPLDLKQSPLVIDHQKGFTSPVRENFEERRSSGSSKASKSTTKDKRSSMSVVKDFIKEGRASLSDRRPTGLELAGASVLSPTNANGGPRLARSPSISSRKSGRELGGLGSPTRSPEALSPTKDDKANRASRLLRRMSSSISSSRKTLAHAMSPTLREESEPTEGYRRAQSSPSPTITSINIGDVNVQFPDSLLWKRRSMTLDSQGFLIISPALSAKDNKNVGATRRMHLSEFRTPEIPDVEMQELPNSVVLEFREGSGLQVACEDRDGQARVLKILLEAHNKWALPRQ